MNNSRQIARMLDRRASRWGGSVGWLVVLGVGVVVLRPVLVGPALAAKPSPTMVEALVDGRVVEGQPLAWSDERVFLLSRDGQLVDFAPQEASDYRETSDSFSSYPIGKIRGQLREEFGSGFDITGTGHYLVVHPSGQSDQWARRFEDLYRSFYNYFRVRGFSLREPEFPLVAVIFSRKEDYQRHARANGTYLGPSVLGHYSPRTNRISMFDVTGGDESQVWSKNAATIIHEVTHQVAFNCGVHTRFNDVPRWVSEGLATMFEARGVWNSIAHKDPSDRINRGRLGDFKRHVAKHPKAGSMIEMIASDGLFRANPEGAYAQAWAVSYYLCQTQPQRYSEYLARTAKRSAFQEYSQTDRMADFRTVFGDDLEMVEAEFLRYIAHVR